MFRLFSMLLAAVLFLPGLCLPAAAEGLYSRDLNCEEQASDRAREICHALEGALEWTWKGHAIISPSYRVTSESERRVFCELPITASDTHTLVNMALDSDFRYTKAEARISNGSRGLLKLLGQQALDHFPGPDDLSGKHSKTRRNALEYLKQEIEGAISRPENIYNPSHRNYILRGGCDG